MLARLLVRCFHDRRANVLPIFAVAIIPIIAFVGTAVDYTLAAAVRSQMQGALDATALMLSKEVGNLNSTQLSQKATDYFNAIFNRPEAQNVTITASYSQADGAVLTVTGSGTVKTNLTNVLGFSQMDFASSSTVKWGSTKLRVALALDNTGSMTENNKIGALKTATHELLTTLQNASANPGDVQVAIVPFAKDVNVGAANYTANWIDWTAWDAANGTWGGSGFCFIGWCWNGNSWVPATWTPKNHNTWNGCVTDRDQDFDVLNTNPVPGNVPTLFPAEQYNACPVAIMPLTHNWAALNSLVDQMQANGATNQPIGLAWAWHVLTPSGPFGTSPLPPETQQVIILLSDGLNTQDRWYGNGSNPSTQIDARMAIVCANAKAAGIQIYTVLVMSGNSSVLQSCASKSEMYFALSAAGEIVTAFNQIGTQIAQLRIAK